MNGYPLLSIISVIHFVFSFSFCVFILGWAIFYPNRSTRWLAPVCLAGLFILRLPSILYNREINPDESQMITQAMTLVQDPVYFRSVDGTTGGPLSSYLLILPALIGFPFNYIVAHFVASLLIAISLWLVYRAARIWFGERPAHWSLLALIFWLGLAHEGDFLHFSSELVPVLILSWATLCYVRQIHQSDHSLRLGQFVLSGFLLGLVPFGKLQAVPMGVILGATILIDMLTRPGLSPSSKLLLTVATIGGVLLFPTLFICFMAVTGELSNFWTFYIEANLNYGSGHGIVESILSLPHFFGRSQEFSGLVILTIVSGCIALVNTLLRKTGNEPTLRRRPVTFLAITVFVALLAITRTTSEYLHYLFFLMGPLLLLNAWCWHITSHSSTVFTQRLIAVGLTSIFLGFQLIASILLYQQPDKPLYAYFDPVPSRWLMPHSAMTQTIHRFAKPGEPLVVWGWRCDYYVEAQMPQGVAENHSIRSVFDHPMLNRYQQRYVQDFTRSFPPVFVDAVGPQNLWMNNRQTQGHELIKPLNEFVKANYQYIGEVNYARVYARNDRYESVQ